MVHIATKNPAYESYAQKTISNTQPLIAQALATTTGIGRSDPTLASRLPGSESGTGTVDTAAGAESGQTGAAGESAAAWKGQGGCSCGKGGGDNAGADAKGDAQAGLSDASARDNTPVSDRTEPVA